ncbi:chaoptin-like [Culicoides brevitarsis]|uniref:chaoptin-like n=1 Tax=Culicoides brevitarsis TaxID=469753 RepID=UPI00307B2D9B
MDAGHFLRIFVITLGLFQNVITNVDEDGVVSQVLNCSFVFNDVFYNTRACIFEDIYLLENEPFKIDTTYEGKFIHQGLFKTIKFVNSHIAYVPKRFFQVFFNTERFIMNSSEVAIVHTDAFVHAANVREIYLDHNKIEILEDQCFTPAHQASLVDLSHNNLVIFNKKAFDSQRQLRRLFLSYNRIQKLDKDAFHTIPQLSVIKLDNNLITSIEKDLFERNLFIEEIDLSHNKLMTLELYFKGDRLRRLNAHNNNIQKFLIASERPTFDVNVNLSSNRIVQFCLPERIEIVKLCVENNRLGKSLIEISNITAVTSLRELYLGHNMLPPLEPETFSWLKNLKYLGLPNTDLHELRKEVMASLENLTVFDISYNPLRTIDLNALTPLRNLRSLYINGDELNGMDIRNVKDYLPNIFEIEVSDTEWSCAYLEDTINDMRNKSIFLKANQDRYVYRKQNINGIPCYGLHNGTYGNNFIEDDNVGVDRDPISNFEWNWFIIGGTILAIVLAIILVAKTVGYFVSNRRERQNGYHQRPNARDIFTEIQYNSDYYATIVFQCDESRQNHAYNGTECTIRRFRPPFKEKYNFAGVNTFEILELRFVESKFSKLPQMVFKMYDRIEWLEAERVDLRSLEAGCLYHARYLKTFIAPYNKIGSLDKFTFYGAEQLTWINMSHNVIERIHPAAFRNLTKLEVLDFSKNRIGALDKMTFINQKRLKFVFLDGNRLVTIDSYLFHSSETLESLLLNDNYLDQLHLHLRNNHVTHLYAMNNRIKKFHLDADNKDFEDHNFYVELRDNKIHQFYVSPRLTPTYLSLANNNMKYIGNVTQLRSLTYLDLSHNQLEYSITNVFENLTELQELYLSNVGTNILENVQFIQQSHMKHLDLSGNDINDIDIETLPPSIEELDLSQNNLTIIHSVHNMTLSEAMPNLTRLDLSDNPQLDIQKINELASDGDVVVMMDGNEAIVVTSDRNLTYYVNRRLSDLLMEIHKLQSHAMSANMSNYRRIENSENHLKALNLFLMFLLIGLVCLFVFTIYLYATLKSKAL